MKGNILIALDKIMFIRNSIKTNEVIINLKDEKLKGNVLDIGMDNHGVIYQMCKINDDDLSVDYIQKEEDQKVIEKNWYDTAVLFFTIGKLGLNINKKRLLEEIYDYLKEDGEIKIWDIDKCAMSIANFKVKVLLPGKKVKNILLRDFNFFKDRSKENVEKLLSPMFEIIEMSTSNNIYYIRGRKIKKGMT